MLIYEKKVNTAAEGEPEVLVRKLFGTLGHVPSDEDEEITVTGGSFEIDNKGRVLIPKEADADEDENEDEDPDAEEAEDEKEVVKLIYGTEKKMQFSVSGIPDFENDTEVSVKIGDNIIIGTGYTISVAVAEGCEDMGSVSGGATGVEGEEVTIEATANDHFKFVKWNDDETANPRTITIGTENVTYTATFEAKASYTITVVADPEVGGTVSGAGSYEEGVSVTISAAANEDYTFTSWNDGNTEASRSFTASADVTYTATFTPVPKKTSYTVHYYESGTTTSLVTDKEVSDVDVGTVITENAETVEGYTPDEASKEITLVEDAASNVITFEYTSNNNQPEE